MDKINIKETIVVEGRDDTAAVKQAVDGFIIETHGFGIKRQTWELIERAYNNGGIIIFTDPDFSGEEIRRKLTEKFPSAKQAFLDRKLATKKGDIGIENARPEDIAEALTKAHCTVQTEGEESFSQEDLFHGRTCRRQNIGPAAGTGRKNPRHRIRKRKGIPGETKQV